MKKTLSLAFLIFFSSLFCVVPRKSSYPYISGDTFREHCRWVLDVGVHFDPNQVKEGDVIFVGPQGGGLSQYFSNYLPNMSVSHILVTHNTDSSFPGKYASYLDEKKIIGWFGQNWDGYQHPKIHPIPIGVANAISQTDHVKQLSDAVKKSYKRIRRNQTYMNFSRWTNPSERQSAFDIFHTQSFCFTATPKPFFYYLNEMSYYRFVISPHGNGLDCFRTWESLLLGCIPIVKTSTLDGLYEDLPVIIVDDWHDVTQEFLDEKYAQMNGQTFNTKKLYFDYWWQQILDCQAHYLNARVIKC